MNNQTPPPPDKGVDIGWSCIVPIISIIAIYGAYTLGGEDAGIWVTGAIVLLYFLRRRK